jgi:hypothetical protein
MGFSTTFYIAYQADPGTVTATSIRSLISAVAPVVECEDGWRNVSLRFGAEPAMSNDPFFYDVPIASRLSITRSNWDFESSPESHRELLDSLASHGHQSIHRALLTFGHLPEGEGKTLTREPDERNSEGLYPDNIGLAIGPIEVQRDDDHDEVVQIGWVSFSIYFHGYCYPWLHQDLIERCLKTRFTALACDALLALFGPVPDKSVANAPAACRKRTRILPGRVIAGVAGI